MLHLQALLLIATTAVFAWVTHVVLDRIYAGQSYGQVLWAWIACTALFVIEAGAIILSVLT